MTAYRLHGRKFLVTAAAASLLVLPAPAASAQPEERGAGQDRAEQQVTEDDDTNDGGTPEDVADDGDDAHPSGRDRSVEPGGNPNKGNAQHDPDGDANGGVDQPGGDGGEDLADQDGNNGCGNDDDFEDDNNGNCGGSERGAEMRSAAAERREQRETERETEEREAETEVAGTSASQGSEDLGGDGTTDSTDSTGDASTTSTGTLGASLEEDQELGDEAGAPVELAVLGVSFEQPQATTTALVATEVLGVSYTAAPAGEATVAGGDVTTTEVLGVAAADVLPRTGAGAAGLLAMGITTLAGGSALLRRRR